mgnify:CR=1 FL=1
MADYLQPSGYDQMLRQLRDTWDNIGYQWNKWVVNYDTNTQRELLKNLGLEQGNSLYTLVGIMGAGALGILLFYFWQLVPKAIKRGEAQKAYLQFVHKFARYNINKEYIPKPSSQYDTMSTLH